MEEGNSLNEQQLALFNEMIGALNRLFEVAGAESSKVREYMRYLERVGISLIPLKAILISQVGIDYAKFRAYAEECLKEREKVSREAAHRSRQRGAKKDRKALSPEAFDKNFLDELKISIPEGD